MRCGALWGGEIPDDQLNCREKLHMQPSVATLCCARLVKKCEGSVRCASDRVRLITIVSLPSGGQFLDHIS